MSPSAQARAEKLARRERPAPPPDALTYTLQGASLVSGLSIATLRRREKEGLLVVPPRRRTHAGRRRSLRRMLGVSTD